MYGEEIIVPAIVFGSAVAIVFMGILGSIIKTAIKKKSGGNLSENKEFLEALRDFKEKTDQRLKNLESIAADDFQPGTNAKTDLSNSSQKSTIDIELETHSSKDHKKESGNLRNMLNQ